MNSANLRSKFMSEYETFFAKHKYVFSTSAEICLLNNHKGKGSPIRQKLPLKIYIGINILEKSEIVFNGSMFYNKLKNSFEEMSSFSLISKKEYLEEFLLWFLDKEFKVKGKGLQISVFSEIPLGQYIYIATGFPAIISYALYYIFGEDKSVKDGNWNDIDIDDFAKLDNTHIFRKIYLLSLKLFMIWSKGLTHGYGSFMSLVNTESPIFFYTPDSGKIPKFDFETEFRNRFTSLDDIVLIPKVIMTPFDRYPFDIALVYSGFPVLVDQYLKSYNNSSNRMLDESNMVLLKEIFKNDNMKDDINVDDSCDIGERKMFSAYFIKLVLNMVNQLMYFNENGHEEQRFLDMVGLFHKQRLLMFALEKVCKDVKVMIFDFMNYYAKYFPLYDKFAVAPHGGSTMGGDIMIVTPVNVHRHLVTDMLETLNKEHNNELYITWTSWDDGYGRDGVKVEQDKEKNVSPYLLQGRMYEVYRYKSGQYTEEVLNKEYVEELRKKADIFMDAINNQVCIKGQKLDSTQLKSRAQTITVLKEFLINKVDVISNDMLPVSSYRSSKNEMNTKVINPFVNLVKKKTKIKLGLLAIGDNNKYKITADFGDVDIVLIVDL